MRHRYSDGMYNLARGSRPAVTAMACVGRMIYLTGGLAPSVVSLRDENKVIHLYDAVMQSGVDVPIHGFDGDVICDMCKSIATHEVRTARCSEVGRW